MPGPSETRAVLQLNLALPKPKLANSLQVVSFIHRFAASCYEHCQAFFDVKMHFLAVKPCNLFTGQTPPGVLEESCGFGLLSRVVKPPSNFCTLAGAEAVGGAGKGIACLCPYQPHGNVNM